MIKFLQYLAAIIIYPFFFILRPRTAMELFRVESHQTEIVHSNQNEEILRQILNENKIILKTFIDDRFSVIKYDSTIELSGHYGGMRNVQCMEIWFKSSEDKVVFLLKYPDKFALGKEILKRGGSFNDNN